MFSLCFLYKNMVLKHTFLAFPRGLGVFRKLREDYRNHFHRSWYLPDAVVTKYSQKPCRNHFHRSWYLSDAVVTNYSQKHSWGDFFLPSTVALGGVMVG